MSVGRPAGGGGEAKRTAGTFSIDHNERLAEFRAHAFTEGAGDDIGHLPDSERYDELDRPLRIGLRVSLRADGAAENGKGRYR